MAEEKRKNMTIIYVRRVLEDYSDEEHHLTQNVIGEYIEMEYGVKPERKSIGRSLVTLRDDFGLDIKSDRKGSWLASRTFDDVEIRLLIDSVMGNRYIPEEDAEQIIGKLEDLATVYFSSQSKNIYVMDEKRRTNISGLFKNLETVGEAIKEGKAIYYEDIQGNKVLRDKRLKSCVCSMTVFPICIIFIEHRYYAVARYMGDSFIRGSEKHLAYIPLHNIENIRLMDPDEHCTPLTNAEKKNIKLMVKGENLQDGIKKSITFIAPKTLSLIIQANFAESKELMSDISGGSGSGNNFLPNLTKSIYEVNTTTKDFLKFYREHMVVIKVITPKSIVRKIDADFRRALKNNGKE